MAKTAQVDDALECDDCNKALDWHLAQCRPIECPLVAAWVADTYEPRAAAMAVMLDAGDAVHGPDGCSQHHR